MVKTKSTKRALLTSALSLLLCVSMLIGTTFAWFTDSVTSGNNIIKSGNLDVEMFWADGKNDPATTAWTDASTGAIFNYTLWEPGYTEVRHVKIENVGSLALKYVVNFKANGVVSKLADAIDVYFVDPAVQVADRTVLTDAYKVGTLTDVLAGVAGTTKGELLAGEGDTVTIALKMRESAGNEYQNLELASDFVIQVLATQLTSEVDSFDDQYDKDAVTYVAYDNTKTVAENATALKTALADAKEGDIILVGAGNWYATQYKQFAINADNVTLVGETGAVLGFEAENKNSILDVHGDNVTIKNIEFNKNKQEFNQCLLAIGAENLTVDNCTFYGDNYQGGNTPTMGIYILENLDMASDEANDEVTKYTITNNNFLGAAVGSYKGGANTVPTDPGAAAATVSEDMVIANNIFVGANILIENWRSWSKEANRDHKFVPTITDNTFESPNLCFANTPHSIYLRCYRQGNPDKILPAGYIDAFVANNTIATPKNDTVVTYGGSDYVLSDAYGTFYRDNATYGIIAYCYGQSYAKVADSQADLSAAVASGDDVYVSAGEYTFPAAGMQEGQTIVCEEGTVFKGVSSLNVNGATVVGATFKATTDDKAVSGTIDGTFKNCVFEGVETLRWCYTSAGETVVFEDCVIKTTLRGVHFDEMNGNVIFKNCEINGFNAYSGSGTMTFEGCTFGHDQSKYNGLNIYSNTNLIDCTFNFVSGNTNFIDMEGTGKTLTIKNCTATMDGAAIDIADMVGGSKLAQNTVIFE